MTNETDRDRAERLATYLIEEEAYLPVESILEEFAAVRTPLEAEIERLRAALAVYASEDSWQCPRCHGSDSLNCGLVLWIGPVGMPAHRDDGVADLGEYHGYTVARAALRGTE